MLGQAIIGWHRERMKWALLLIIGSNFVIVNLRLEKVIGTVLP